MTTSSTITAKLQFWQYRLATILKSFKILYNLPPEKVDAFVNSYKIYDHDWANEKELIEAMGVDYYNEIQKKLVDWYSVLNHLCALGQVEKMYIPPAMDLSLGIIENQLLFEKKLGRDLGLEKGKKALDIGCGRGRIASHIATYTGANIVGMNIDPDQLEAAHKFVLGNGLTDQCQFIYGDLNNLPLPFPDGSLDAVYHIQVFSLAKDLPKLLKDIYRVLKPGGRFGCLDWVSLPDYNPKNPHHADLMRRTKSLIGAIGVPSPDTYVELLKQAGFEVITSENASVDGLQAPLIEKADKFYTRVYHIINLLVKYRVLPTHFQRLFDRLTQDGEAFVEADRLRLVTTSHYIIAKKTKYPKSPLGTAVDQIKNI